MTCRGPMPLVAPALLRALDPRSNLGALRALLLRRVPISERFGRLRSHLVVGRGGKLVINDRAPSILFQLTMEAGQNA